MTTGQETGRAGTDTAVREITVRGPAFEDLFTGQVFDTCPPVTLTDGFAAAHQAIVGERSWLALSRPLAAAVLGGGPVAPPSLVWNVSIGQSTLATQQVLANLYYRGLVLHRQPRIGDTLETVTLVTGLRQNRPRPGGPATGLAALRITTRDQHGAIVLDYERCAMIPLRDQALVTGWQDDLTAGQREIGDDELLALTAGWVLTRPALPVPEPGTALRVDGRDVVSSGPGLARLTMNIAAVHHDAVAAGGRYGRRSASRRREAGRHAVTTERLLIRGGTVIDGSGGEPYVADVLLADPSRRTRSSWQHIAAAPGSASLITNPIHD